MKEIFWHNLKIEDVISLLRTDIKNGLEKKEVEIRQKKFGKNKLPEEKTLSGLKIFLEQFKSLFIYILVLAGIITLILRDFTDAIVIFGAVFLNTAVGFWQENKASKTLQALKKVVKHEAEVLREGNFKIIDSSELVPGDIIILHPGEKIPADGRVIECHNLKINEMVLTGEWMVAEKNPVFLPKETSLADRNNMVYMGTIVEEGKGKVIVTTTGINTELGKIAKFVREKKEEKTPYQKKVIYLSNIIGVSIVFFSFLIFILGIINGRDLFEMFLTVVAVAVAAIPEGLPVAITVILALGMQRILKRQGLVKKMIAAETLGSTSIICTDKTGTLTEGKMKVTDIFPAFIENKDLGRENGKIFTISAASLSCEAFIKNPKEPKEKWLIHGRPTEKAILKAGIEMGINQKEKFEKKKIAEFLFNPINKFSASLYEENGQQILYICGAPEKILDFSKLTDEENRRWQGQLEELTKKGLRVVASAYKKISNHKSQNINLEKEMNNLTFLGLIALNDSIRPDVKEAMKICRQAGIKLIIVTGDHKLTAQVVAEELGFKIKKENILEGKDLDRLSDEEFEKILDKIQIYVRVEPKHKMRIIDAWQKKGKVVAMTGDGINDATALKEADIGVALGSGTEVAKETSDLILLNDSFSIIQAAVEEGRIIVDNIRKVTTLLVSHSFSEIVLIGGSVLLGLPLPVLPTQILWVNLIEGSPRGVALAFEPKEGGIMEREPEDPKHPLLTKKMKVIISASVFINSFIFFSLFLSLLKLDFPLTKIRTIIFAALAIDTLFYVFSCKNLRKNIWQYNPFSNLYLNFAVIFSFFLLLIAIYFPLFQKLLKTIPINLFDWTMIFGLGLTNMILVEIIKWYFIVKK